MAAPFAQRAQDVVLAAYADEAVVVGEQHGMAGRLVQADDAAQAGRGRDHGWFGVRDAVHEQAQRAAALVADQAVAAGGVEP